LLWEARSAGQAPGIDGVCYISDPGPSPLAQGQMRVMRITKAHDYDLVGDLVDAVVEPVAELANPFNILPGGLVAGHAVAGLPHR